MGGFQLFEHAQARAFLRLCLQITVLRRRRFLQRCLHLAQTLLPLLHRAALGLRVELFGFDLGGEFLQTRLQPDALLLELNFFRREFLQPDNVALFLEIEGGDFVAYPGEVLGRGEGVGLRLPQGFLIPAQRRLNLPQSRLAGGQRFLLPLPRAFRRRQPLLNRCEFLRRHVPAFLGLGDVGEGFFVLRGEFLEAFLVELNAALVPFALGFQLQPALLRGGDAVFQFAELSAQRGNFAFALRHAMVRRLDFLPQLFGGGFPRADFALPHIKLMPRQLGVQVLQFRLQRPVPARLAGLALQRADLSFDLADEIADAQKILFRGFQFAQALAFLGFELGDAGGLFKNQPPVLGFAGQKLGDVALRHDAVAGAPHPRAHEQLLDVPQPARHPVDEILAAAIPEHPAGQSDFVVGNLHPGRPQMLGIHPAQGEGHLRHPQRFAAVGALKNHIRHFRAAQRFGRLLAQHPTNGIRHIGFAATIGADDGRNTALKIERRFIAKRLEPQQGQIFQIHVLGSKQSNIPGRVKWKNHNIQGLGYCRSTSNRGEEPKSNCAL
ncbi:MAG: hypothetical protein BWX84_01186 [Verrucomicrobia bacterium ADurb.Bin118]|nr:MAG: hypothetical protein BWX84_01186 [Verrucomicrobia bacterium ADurb.Bin118]